MSHKQEHMYQHEQTLACDCDLKAAGGKHFKERGAMLSLNDAA